jgi:hypothetical protein
MGDNGSTLSSAMTPALSFVMTRVSSWLGSAAPGMLRLARLIYSLANLAMVMCETLKLLAISVSVSPASRLRSASAL